MKRKYMIVCALCAILMHCAVQPATAAAYGLGDIFSGFSEVISEVFSGNSVSYPEYPVPFVLEGRKMTMPCKFSAFLSSDWKAYDRITDQYVSGYELVYDSCMRELVLRKNDQEILIDIRNDTNHVLEVMNCDVEKIAVEAFSYVKNKIPNIEIYGIRPGKSIDRRPEWMKKRTLVLAGAVQCDVDFSREDQYGSARIEASRSSVHIYYSFDDEGMVEYISLETFP